MYGGGVAMFSCNYGYVLQGERILTCDGQKWNGTAPDCIGKAKPGIQYQFNDLRIILILIKFISEIPPVTLSPPSTTFPTIPLEIVTPEPEPEPENKTASVLAQDPHRNPILQPISSTVSSDPESDPITIPGSSSSSTTTRASTQVESGVDISSSTDSVQDQDEDTAFGTLSSTSTGDGKDWHIDNDIDSETEATTIESSPLPSQGFPTTKEAEISTTVESKAEIPVSVSPSTEEPTISTAPTTENLDRDVVTEISVTTFPATTAEVKPTIPTTKAVEQIVGVQTTTATIKSMASPSTTIANVPLERPTSPTTTSIPTSTRTTVPIPSTTATLTPVTSTPQPYTSTSRPKVTTLKPEEILTSPTPTITVYPTRNTVTTVVVPKRKEKIQIRNDDHNSVYDKRERQEIIAIAPEKIDQNHDHHLASEHYNFAHLLIIVGTVLITIGSISIMGGVFMYCWRKNKGIARARATDLDGRTLSYNEANEELTWLDCHDNSRL